MADLAIQEVTEGGLTASYAAAVAGGDSALNIGGDVILHVKNGGAGVLTVTVTAQRTSKQIGGFGVLTKADIAVSVAAGQERFIGPFPIRAFNDSTGRVRIGYDQVVSVTVAALRVTRAA